MRYPNGLKLRSAEKVISINSVMKEAMFVMILRRLVTVLKIRPEPRLHLKPMIRSLKQQFMNLIS